jgi:hypothetical protein
LYWGIKNGGVVVGVRLNYEERRRIREEASVQFSQIRPLISLLNFSVEFHPVLDELGEKIDDLWVCELCVQSGNPKQLYRTGSGAVVIKTAWVETTREAVLANLYAPGVASILPMR